MRYLCAFYVYLIYFIYAFLVSDNNLNILIHDICVCTKNVERRPCEPGKCELHDIADCEWCALGVKNRSMYGRLWPYAEHPVTREHYCLEPVESPTGGKFPCCSFRREKPIKTSQGYAGHLASHRAHIQGSTNTINGVGVAPVLLVTSNGGSGGGSAASPSSNGDQALGKKRKRESTLTGSHETVATSTMSTTVSTTSSSSGGGGKVMPQFVASLQPSLPRCDLEAGQLRFILLPQDSEAAAIDVVFKVPVGPPAEYPTCHRLTHDTTNDTTLCRGIVVS
jgi:hypothetical protein